MLSALSDEPSDGRKIGVRCPRCGERQERPIEWLLARESLRCTECHVTIRLDHQRLKTLLRPRPRPRRLALPAMAAAALLTGLAALYLALRPDPPPPSSAMTTIAQAVPAPAAEPLDPPPADEAAPLGVINIPAAQSALCARQPANGDVLAPGRYAASGPHAANVTNQSGANAIVNVRWAHNQELVASFFVAAGTTASIAGLPTGSFRTQFALGDALGPDCVTFANPSRIEENERLVILRLTDAAGKPAAANDLTLTLAATRDGAPPSHTIPPAIFYAR